MTSAPSTRQRSGPASAGVRSMARWVTRAPSEIRPLVDLDAGEPGHAAEPDHVARRDAPALDLHDQVGSAGQKARPLAEARGEIHRVGQALGLVVLEAAHARKSFALTWGGQIEARRAPASTSRGASAWSRSSESR